MEELAKTVIELAKEGSPLALEYIRLYWYYWIAVHSGVLVVVGTGVFGILWLFKRAQDHD